MTPHHEQSSIQVTELDRLLPKSTHDDVRRMAAVGLSARQIAAALDLTAELATVFIDLAKTPDSVVARMIEEGRALGISQPQLKLQAAANAGNIDAIKTLQKLQRDNRIKEQICYMDDDEFAS